MTYYYTYLDIQNDSTQWVKLWSQSLTYISKEPATVIQKVNEFMGLGRSQELVEKIAQATNFASMKEGKRESSERIVQHMQKMVKSK